MEPKNKIIRTASCRPEDFFPEICYPKNDKDWSRLTTCDAQGNPCALDKNGLRRPAGTRPEAAPRSPGVVVGNVEYTALCDGGYSQVPPSEVTGANVGTVTMPADQFLRFIDNANDAQAIADAQELVDNLAKAYAFSQLICYKWNDAQDAECPPATGTDILNTARVTSFQQPSESIGILLSGVAIVTTEEDRLSLTSVDAPVDSIFYVLQSDTYTFYKILDHNNLDYNASYEEITLADLYIEQSVRDLDDANTTALSTAASSVSCEYLSPEVTLSCPNDPNGAAPSGQLGTGTSTQLEGTLSYALTGILPGETLVSTPDQTGLPSLEERAKVLAMLSLECVYTNPDTTVECPAAYGTTPAFGGTLEVPNSYTVVEGMYSNIITYSELDDPDGLNFVGKTVETLTDEALAVAWATLQCLYPSSADSGSCPTDATSVLCGSQTSNVAYVDKISTLKSGAITESDNCDISRGPVFAQGEDSPKSRTFLPVLENADASLEGGPNAASSLIYTCMDTPAEKTAFQSVVTSRCPAGLEAGGPWLVDSEKSFIAVANTGLFYIAAVNLQADPQAAANEAKDEADELAANYVAGLSLCLWSNEEVPAIDCPYILRQDEGSPVQVHYAVERPGRVICAGEFTSSISKLDAQRAAWAAAIASRECTPTTLGNVPVKATCPAHNSGASLYDPASKQPEFAEDTFRADTEYEATIQAWNAACASRICAWGNAEVNSPGCGSLGVGEYWLINQTGTVKANEILSYSVNTDPTTQAQALANALEICVPFDNTGGGNTCTFTPESPPYEWTIGCGGGSSYSSVSLAWIQSGWYALYVAFGNAEMKEVTLCEDGSPTDYYIVAWPTNESSAIPTLADAMFDLWKV